MSNHSSFLFQPPDLPNKVFNNKPGVSVLKKTLKGKAYFFWAFLVLVVLLSSGSAFAADQTVTNLNDDTNPGSLRWAINNTGDGDKIIFSSELEGTITLASELPDLESVTVENASGITIVREVSGAHSYALKVTYGNTISGTLPGGLTATANGSYNAYGIGAAGGSAMTMNDISGNITANAGGNAYALDSNGATINVISGDVTANADGSAYGLNSNDVISINDISGAVTANAGGDAFGLSNDDAMTINDISGAVKVNAGNNAYGLKNFNSTMTVTDISGAVTVGADNYAYGLYGNHSAMTIKDVSGAVKVNADSRAYGLLSDYGDMTIKDISGAVTVEADAWAFGLRSYNGDMIIDDISGVVTANAAGTLAAGLFSYRGAITGPGGTPANISGTVSAVNTGLAVAIGADEGMNLNITGTITAIDSTGGDGAYAIAAGFPSGGTVSGKDYADTVVLGDGADITGKIDLGQGINLLTLDGAGTLKGAVNNITTLTKTGLGHWETSGKIQTRDFVVNKGTMTIDDSASHTITNNLFIGEGAVLTAGINTTASETVIIGNTLTNNGSLVFELNTLLPGGTSYTALIANSIEGTGTYTVGGGGILMDLRVNASDIKLTKRTYSQMPLDSANARAMAAMLDTQTASATGDMALLLLNLENSATEAEFNTCLEELFAHTGLSAMGMNTARQFSMSVQNRMSWGRAQAGQADRIAKTFLNPDDPDSWPRLASAGDMAGLFDRQPDQKPHGVFIKTLNQKGTRDSEIGYTGYDHDTMGFSGGIDRVFSKRFLAGISLGYAKNNVDYKDAGGSHTDVSNLGTGVYASLFDNQWYVDALFSGTRNTSHANRNIAFLNTTAQSEQEGYTMSGKLGGGYRFIFNDIGLSPLLSLEYMYFQQDAYTETGAGSANLSVESLSSNSLKTGMGLKLDRTFKPNQWWSLTPEVSARWMHEFIDQNQDIQVSMTGVPGRIFSQETTGPRDDSLRIRAGVTAQYETDFALLFHYLGEFEKDAQSHGLTCEFQYFF